MENITWRHLAAFQARLDGELGRCFDGTAIGIVDTVGIAHSPLEAMLSDANSAEKSFRHAPG